jgi:hypothetical protein
MQGLGCRVWGGGLRHGTQQLAQCAGQHVLLDVQGAELALVVRQHNINLCGVSGLRSLSLDRILQGILRSRAVGYAGFVVSEN